MMKTTLHILLLGLLVAFSPALVAEEGELYLGYNASSLLDESPAELPQLFNNPLRSLDNSNTSGQVTDGQPRSGLVDSLLSEVHIGLTRDRYSQSDE